MAYKVGATTVINDSGNIDWGRITGAPSFGTGDVTGVYTSSPVNGGGPYFGFWTPNMSFACTYNCYVRSLSGGGSSGELTIVGNQTTFNCNCNCRC
jgi:hypothetical protein